MLKNPFKKPNITLHARRGHSLLLVLAILVTIVAAGGVVGLRVWYNNQLSSVSSSTKTQYFTVQSGTGLNEIADNLKDVGLIRSPKAFETYVRGNELETSLQAGTYTLSPSMSVQQIVKKMVDGDVTKNLLTILPGQTVTDIEKTFAKAGYSQTQIDTAFNPASYSGNPALTSLPSGASLEGMLYPDSFEQDANTSATAIVQESLNEMASHLTSDITDGFAAQGLSTYQGITLASIVTQESGNSTDQPTIAQVFLLRIKDGMMLQSNVTADYAADQAGVPRTVTIDSPYNTYLHTGLPPGPISTVTASALKAVAHPSNSSYLYFTADDNGTVYFETTADQHQQDIDNYCHKLCAQ